MELTTPATVSRTTHAAASSPRSRQSLLATTTSLLPSLSQPQSNRISGQGWNVPTLNKICLATRATWTLHPSLTPTRVPNRLDMTQVSIATRDQLSHNDRILFQQIFKIRIGVIRFLLIKFKTHFTYRPLGFFFVFQDLLLRTSQRHVTWRGEAAAEWDQLHHLGIQQGAIRPGKSFAIWKNCASESMKTRLKLLYLLHLRFFLSSKY